MIVNRSHAEEARATLEIAPALDDITLPLVKAMYRLRAIEHHPDKGGKLETFVAMDRARAILELWLAKRGAEQPVKALKASVCPRCQGKGRIKQHRGFTAMTVTCVTCRGTGDGAYDHDRSRE